MAKSEHSGVKWIDGGTPPTVDGEMVRNDINLVNTLGLHCGYPGERRAFSAGEGQPYQEDLAGTTVVKAFTYDASAASGARFSASLDLNAQNTWLGDAGDRFYVGGLYKFWLVQYLNGIAKTTETLEAYYWNGVNLVPFTYMGVLTQSKTSLANAILEQTVEKENIVLAHWIDVDWATADNVLDQIPNTGTPLYWMCFQVPAGGLATPPRVDEIKVRGSSWTVDRHVGTPVVWGYGRAIANANIAFDVRKSPAGTPTATIFTTSTSRQVVYNLRSTMNDDVSLRWKIPHGIDTSCGVWFELDFIASGPINPITIRLDLKKWKNGTAISNAVFSDHNGNTNIVVGAPAMNTFIKGQALVTAHFDISDLKADDEIAINIQRVDGNGNSVYPLELHMEHVLWMYGDHVKLS